MRVRNKQMVYLAGVVFERFERFKKLKRGGGRCSGEGEGEQVRGEGQWKS